MASKQHRRKVRDIRPCTGFVGLPFCHTTSHNTMLAISYSPFFCGYCMNKSRPIVDEINHKHFSSLLLYALLLLDFQSLWTIQVVPSQFPPLWTVHNSTNVSRTGNHLWMMYIPSENICSSTIVFFYILQLFRKALKVFPLTSGRGSLNYTLPVFDL